MRIHLPNSAFLGNIDAFFKQFDLSDREKLEITANKKWLSIHPMVLSMVAALAETVERSNLRCEKIEAKSGHYLQRMGLFSFLGMEADSHIAEHDPSGRFIPLTQIRDSTELTRFVTDMIPLLHLEPAEAEPIQYIVSELVRNVLEHASTPAGAFVAAQYYKKSNRVAVGIADTGVGIKTSITVSHDAQNDLDAIQLALTPGITGMTKREGGTELNAGAGLFFIKSIAAVNGDFFVIYSGQAMYKLLKRKKTRRTIFADPFLDRHSKEADLPYWQGTAVGIDLSLSHTPEFSVLLDVIRDTYAKAIRERKERRHKQARFI